MNKVRIKVCDSSKHFINYLIYNKIYYDSLEINDCSYYLNVVFDDYKKISRRYETYVVSYFGKYKIKNFMYVNRYLIISMFFGLLLLYNLSITIFDIEINTDDELIRNKIIDSLNKNEISVYKKKKSFSEIEKIKENILKENEDILEWLEIENKGCKYIVNLTKRVKNNTNYESNPSSIIAKKDGLIKHIVIHSGSKIRDVNDYVKKGEVLISGNILKNEEVVDKVKSEGKVYAEVWYLTKVNIPLTYNKKVKTGKVVNRYYIKINNKEFTIIGKYNSDDSETTNKVVIDKPYLPFIIYKEKIIEYKTETIKLDYDGALNKGIEKCENEIKSKLSSDEYIISKNVLKKEVNSSKMYIEVFFKVYENIGLTSNIESIGDNNEISN